MDGWMDGWMGSPLGRPRCQIIPIVLVSLFCGGRHPVTLTNHGRGIRCSERHQIDVVAGGAGHGRGGADRRVVDYDTVGPAGGKGACTCETVGFLRFVYSYQRIIDCSYRVLDRENRLGALFSHICPPSPSGFQSLLSRLYV